MNSYKGTTEMSNETDNTSNNDKSSEIISLGNELTHQ